MFVSKILIIGSSYSIRDTFSKKFKSETLTFLNFRDAWLKKEVSLYDIIIVSGFHHNKIKESFPDFKKYIIEYYNFVLFLESKSNNLILISLGRVIFNILFNTSKPSISIIKIVDSYC